MNNKKSLILMLLLILLFANLVANSRVLVQQSNYDNLNLELLSSKYSLRTIKLDNDNYSSISPSSGELLAGQPNLPIIGRWIIVPNGAKIVVDVLESEEKIFENVNLAPVQHQRRDRATAPNPDFIKDFQIYNQNNFFPNELAKIEKKVIKHNQEYAIIKISPFQYNPVTKILKLYKNMKISISFIGGDKTVINSAKMLSTLNNNIVSQISKNKMTRSTGFDMLIITDDEFISPAEELATWKRQKGLLTKVVTTAEIGNTAEAIEDYINSSCEVWDNDPSYLILFGDAEQIPPHYETIHPYTDGGQGHTGTDIYYADLNDDLVADMAYGRIPVDTIEQADSVVTRIIRYEKNPPTEDSYYQNAVAAAYFQEQNSGNGMAERRFAKTSEDYRNFLQLNDYTVERIYVTDNNTDPMYWNDYNYVFENDIAGEEIPEELQRPNFAWNGNSTDIRNSVNAGKFLLLHRDHGWRQGWGDPYYNINNVNELNNGDLRPVVWTINCETGWFDNETDDISCGTSNSAESFVEAWIRHQTGGSISMIGSTRVSYSGNNDRLIWGVMDAIWPEYLEWAQADYPEHDAIYRLGDALNYGKEYLMANYSWGDQILLTALEEFSVFGDPSMEIFTSLPQLISVDHSESILFGLDEFVVECEVEGAYATMVYNGELVGGATVSGGVATIQMETLENIGEAIITVSKHNYVPYVSTIIVEAEAAYINSELFGIEEVGDFNDLSIQSLDILNLDIMLENIGVLDSGELNLTISALAGRIGIINDSASIENVVAGTNDIIEAAFQIELFEGIIDSTIVTLEILVTDGISEWVDSIEFMVHAAEYIYRGIQVEPEDGTPFLYPGETAEIYASFQNVGSGFGYDIITSLDSDDELIFLSGTENVDVIEPGMEYESIVPFEISLSEEFPIDNYAIINYLVEDLANITSSTPISISVGVIMYDFEDQITWEHCSLSADYGDQWHISDSRNFTIDGNYSYKCGSTTEEGYDMYQHAALYAPEIEIVNGSFLRFWHRMNVGSQINDVSWDGAILEISVDGGAFEQIFPIDGYPSTILNLPTTPFDEDTEVFSGYFDWQEEEFDLSAYPGNGVIRFVFGAANMQTSEGWYIDDIRFGINETTSADEEDVVAINSLSRNFPNPFNPTTTIEFSLAKDMKNAEMIIYNIKGQKVKRFDLAGNDNLSNNFVVWNGTDENNKIVSSGVYFYKIIAGDFSATKKMMLIK